jgi:uncharacterized protein YdgA (DUF945 family)
MIMSDSAEFLKTMIPQKVKTEKKIEMKVDLNNLERSVSNLNLSSKSIMDELIDEAKFETNIRKIPLMGHVDPDIYDKIDQISKKTGRSRSRVVNDVLRKALG